MDSESVEISPNAREQCTLWDIDPQLVRHVRAEGVPYPGLGTSETGGWGTVYLQLETGRYLVVVYGPEPELVADVRIQDGAPS